MYRKLSIVVAATLTCACFVLSATACGNEDKTPAKLTETEWKTAIDNTLNAKNYTLKFDTAYEEAASWELGYNYSDKAIRVLTGGLDIEGMKGTENILREEDGGINIYFRSGESESWQKTAFMDSFYGDTFDEIFSSLQQFDGEPLYAKAAKDHYADAEYHEADGTYTLIFTEEAEIDLIRPDGNAVLTVPIGFVLEFTFDTGYISVMKLSEKEQYEQGVFYETLTFSHFGKTTISAPAI